MEFKEFCEIMKDVPYAENVAYKISAYCSRIDLLPYGITAISPIYSGKYRFPRYSGTHVVGAVYPRAFKNFLGIQYVILPDRLLNIHDNAFEGSLNLKCIWIPKIISKIGRNAFKGCTALTDIFYEGTKQQWDKLNIKPYIEELTSEKSGAVFHEKRIYTGGYEELLRATVHFGCELPLEVKCNE